MAARTTGKPKQASNARSSKALVAKKVVGEKTLPAKSRRGQPTSAKKAVSAKRKAAQEVIAPDLVIQSLRTELEDAQARIKHLEEVNKNVINRIDWVIDSLQSALKR